MKIHEDVETLPIEINVQSPGVTQEEQILTSQYFDETMNVKYYQIPFPRHLLQQNKFKNKSSTLFKSDSNNDRSKSSKFSTFVTQQTRQVDHNLISFQTVFTLDEKNLLNKKFFNDSLTFNSYDVCSRLLNVKFVQRLQQRHKIEQLPVQKTSRRKYSEKEHFDAF